MSTDRFEQLGRDAYRNGESAAPALNADVQAAVADMPVGTGAVAVMSAFARGFDAERDAECARILNGED